MWWKLYFWILLLLTPFGFASLYSGKILTMLDWVDVLLCIGCLLALYAYIYQKSVFTQKVWEVFFWSTVIYMVFWILYYFTPFKTVFFIPPFLMSRSYTDGTIVIWDIFFSLPTYYAIYQLAFSSPRSVKPIKKSKK